MSNLKFIIRALNGYKKITELWKNFLLGFNTHVNKIE